MAGCLRVYLLMGNDDNIFAIIIFRVVYVRICFFFSLCMYDRICFRPDI